MDEKDGDTSNFDGYRSINLEFAKYFELQSVEGSKSTNSRVFR